MFTNKAIDLNNVWIVFKRMKKVNWYHRGPNYQVCSTSARKAVKFNVQQEAIDFAAKLNAGRKSYKFKVEPASKHFVNNWSIGYEHWNKTVVINSMPIGIDRLAKMQSYETYHPSLDSQKSKVIESLNKEIEEVDTRIKGEHSTLQDNLRYAEQEYKRSIEYHTKQHAERVKRYSEEQTKVVGMRDALQNTSLDSDIVEKFATPMDAKAKILFSKRD